MSVQTAALRLAVIAGFSLPAAPAAAQVPPPTPPAVAVPAPAPVPPAPFDVWVVAPPAPPAPPAVPALVEQAMPVHVWPAMPPLPPMPPMPAIEALDFDFDVDVQIDTDAIERAVRSAEDAVARLSQNVQIARPAPLPMRGGAEAQAARRASQAEQLYRQARDLINQNRYERAIAQLDELGRIEGAARADAALYWKAYAQSRIAQRSEALATLADRRSASPRADGSTRRARSKCRCGRHRGNPYRPTCSPTKTSSCWRCAA
jgi:hypothetical protein